MVRKRATRAPTVSAGVMATARVEEGSGRNTGSLAGGVARANRQPARARSDRAPRIQPCSFDPIARFSAISGTRMAITPARRIWSRRRSRIEPQYRARARRRSSGPWPFQVAAASTRSHAVRKVGALDRCRTAVGSPPRRASLTVGEGGGARLGEADVRIAAEPEVAALAVDGQPLHPVAAVAAGLDDEVEGAAIAVAARPQGRDLLDSEASCRGDSGCDCVPRLCHVKGWSWRISLGGGWTHFA